MRIGGNDEKYIFCKVYQYSDLKGLDIDNVLMFQGNVYFNKHNLLINFASTGEKGDHGLQYGTIMVPHCIEEGQFFSDKEQIGILMATADTTHQPAAAAVLIRKVKLEQPAETEDAEEFDREKIADTVKEMTKDNLSDYEKVMEMIRGKGFVVDQR